MTQYIGIDKIDKKYKGLSEIDFGYVGEEAIFSPLDLDNLALWLDASDNNSVQRIGDVVYQWDDLSGNGRHAKQSVEVDKPTYDSINKTIAFAEDFLQFDITFKAKDFFIVCSELNASSELVDATFLIGGNTDLTEIIGAAHSPRDYSLLSRGDTAKGSINDGIFYDSDISGNIDIVNPVNYSPFPVLKTTKDIINVQRDSGAMDVKYIARCLAGTSTGNSNIKINEMICLSSDATVKQKIDVLKYFNSKWVIY